MPEYSSRLAIDFLHDSLGLFALPFRGSNVATWLATHLHGQAERMMVVFPFIYFIVAA